MADGDISLLPCPKCQAPLPAHTFNAVEVASCPLCGVKLRAFVFPALFRGIEKGKAGESLVTENDAGCFYHPAKKAISACEGCGRFLCALCDVLMKDHHLCPACIEAGKRKGKLKDVTNSRTLYDEMALMLTVWPLVIPYFGWICTVFTAPAAIFLGIRYWNAPTSIIQRTKVRFIIAFLLAALQIAGWTALVVFVILYWNKR